MTRTIDGSTAEGELGGGTAGQVPYQSAPDSTDFTGPGTAGQVLTSTGGSAPTFQTLPSSANIPGGTAGQVVYQSAPSTTTFTGPGTSGQVLTSTGGTAPTFQTLSSVPSANNITGGSAGLVLYQSAAGVTSGAGPGTSGQVLTSNGAAPPTYQNVSLSTNASNLSSGTAGQIPYQIAPGSTGFAGPGSSGQYLTSNGTGAPTYTTLITAPTASSIAAGAANQVLYQSASSTTAFAGPGTSGQILTADGSGVPTFQTLTVVPRATNLSGGTVGQLPYQSAVDTTSFVGPGTSGQFLRSNGAAPPSFASVTSQPPTYTIYTSGTGTYIAPANVQYLIVEMIGGGGGGGTNNAPSTCGGGGGSSSYLKLRVNTGNYSYTVGVGGPGGISGGASPADGTNGTATSFGLASCAGGGGGDATSGNFKGGAAGGYGAGGYTVLLAIYGSPGGTGTNAISNLSTMGGPSFWGPSIPPTKNTPAVALASIGYGNGGAGINTNFPTIPAGIAGADGRIIITEIY